jgi:ribosomal protein S18 acetylase RimI-like enzyme
MIFRKGNLNDVDQLVDLGLASYGQYADVLLPEYWNQMKSALKDRDKYPELLKMSTCFVCEIDNVVAGMAFLVPSGNPTDIYQSNWSYIRLVGVLPKHSGKGIAKTLTKMCIEHAKNSGEKIICLHTSEIMHAGRHIYESLGFTVLRDIGQRYGIKYWLYKLDLLTETICKECGTLFHCGSKDNAPCWCNSLPNIIPVEGTTCLCPNCLNKKIKVVSQ